MNRKNPDLKFRKAWSWPSGVEEFLRGLLISPSLHVCCGESELGDVRVDAYVSLPGTVRADMFHLPFRDGAFASVLIDPPWHLAYHLRPRLAKELSRVLMDGGILIFNAPWRISLLSLPLEAVYWADTVAWRNTPLVMIYRKRPLRMAQSIPGQLSDGAGPDTFIRIRNIRTRVRGMAGVAVRRKVIRFGNSRAVVLPKHWVEGWRAVLVQRVDEGTLLVQVLEKEEVRERKEKVRETEVQEAR